MGPTETDASTGIARFWSWIFNCYLVPDGGAGTPLIVDPGMPRLAAAAGQAADRLQRAEAIPVAATHGHTDHVGGIRALADVGDIRLFLPERDIDYLAGSAPRSPTLRALARIWPVMRDVPFEGSALVQAARGGRVAGFGGLGGFRMPLKPAGFLADGDTIPGAPDWAVLRTPGHTDDSICFYNAASRAMFSGDTVLTCRGQAWFNPEYVDGAALGATEDRLRGIRVDTIFPGHGHPITGVDLLARARPHDGG